MSLIITDVSFSYGERSILQDFSLEVGTGTTTAVVAPSGSGKSTLLRIVAGLLRPITGTIILDDREITNTPTHQRSVGMVFQDNQLFPHLNVFDNVAFGLKVSKMNQRDIDFRCHELLELVGLDDVTRQSVATLSGGESKRVALARALAPSPRVLLLDEPLTGLDQELHNHLAQELHQILHSSNTTALLVTHDLSEAKFISDSILHLQ